MKVSAGDRIIYDNGGMLTIGRVLSPSKLGTVAIAAKGKSKWVSEQSIVIAQSERRKKRGNTAVYTRGEWQPVA